MAILLKVIKEDDSSARYMAARSINRKLMKDNKVVTEELYKTLKPANQYLATIVGKAENYEYVSSAVGALRLIRILTLDT